LNNKETRQAIQRQQSEITELQSRLITAENDKAFAVQRNDTLEKKVESLNKFLDQERRLRLDLEAQYRSKVTLDKEEYDKLLQCRERADRQTQREQDLQRQYDYIQIEHKALKTQYEQQASQVERVRNERTEI
jgi:aconitase B